MKRGVITPVYKGKGERHLPDSYRRITVTSLLGKLLEMTLVKPTKRLLEPKLNKLQRGFSEGASSINTALLLTEACAEAEDRKIPLYTAYLDASKAFDVVWHDGMLLQLYQLGIDHDLWLLYRDLYRDMSSAVKIAGSFSREFTEHQGVRQGGIPSTELFKARADALLHRLEKSGAGFHVGAVNLAVPTCADDMVLISESPTDLQVLINVAATDATQQRYCFNPKKTKVQVSQGRLRQTRHVEGCWNLNGEPLQTTDSEVHLGIVRLKNRRPTGAITHNLSKARRALYSLMGAGVHGLNGAHPEVSLKLWHCYIVPRLTYGLEQMICTEADLRAVELFQRSTLRRIQHLPQRTANAAVLLLVGELPIQACVDRKAIALFSSCVSDPSSKEHEVITRQLAVKDSGSRSWVVHVTKLFRQYDLPSPFFLLANPPGRQNSGWKRIVKDSIKKYWMEQLVLELTHKISCRYICMEYLRPGKLHQTWMYTPLRSYDVLQACVKIKMLAGAYLLDADRARIGLLASGQCRICQEEEEDLEHMVIRCGGYQHIRKVYFPVLMTAVLAICGDDTYKACLLSDNLLLKAILDVSHVSRDTNFQPDQIQHLEHVTRKYLYLIHQCRVATSEGEQPVVLRH